MKGMHARTLGQTHVITLALSAAGDMVHVRSLCSVLFLEIYNEGVPKRRLLMSMAAPSVQRLKWLGSADCSATCS